MNSAMNVISALAPFGIGILGMLYWKILPNESRERKRFMFTGGLCLCIVWAVVLFRHVQPPLN